MENASTAPSPSISPGPPHSIVQVDERERNEVPARRIFQDIRETRAVVFDHDENKYKRRPAAEKLKRIWRNALDASQTRNRGPVSLHKKYAVLVILIVFVIAFVLLTMSRLGKYYTENDPDLDPQSNANIRVESR